jgi:hypothetical protein
MATTLRADRAGTPAETHRGGSPCPLGAPGGAWRFAGAFGKGNERCSHSARGAVHSQPAPDGIAYLRSLAGSRGTAHVKAGIWESCASIATICNPCGASTLRLV